MQDSWSAGMGAGSREAGDGLWGTWGPLVCWGWAQDPMDAGMEQGEGARAVPGTCSGSHQVERAAEVLGQEPKCQAQVHDLHFPQGWWSC